MVSYRALRSINYALTWPKHLAADYPRDGCKGKIQSGISCILLHTGCNAHYSSQRLDQVVSQRRFASTARPLVREQKGRLENGQTTSADISSIEVPKSQAMSTIASESVGTPELSSVCHWKANDQVGHRSGEPLPLSSSPLVNSLTLII